MIKQFYLLIVISSFLLLLLSTFNSCVKNETFDKATVETSQVTTITESTAICGGLISADGGSNVTVRGVCWSTLPNPTVKNDTTIDSAGTGPFTSSITGLSSSTTYYVRAYATNSVGTNYGDEVQFITQKGVISIKTSAATFVSVYSATIGCTITSDSGVHIITRGVCWNTSTEPTIANNTTISGNGSSSLTVKITGLKPSTHYFIRVYVTSNFGTVYGKQVNFTTLSLKGTLTDIDGNIYNYVTIGSQQWMVENLKTTKFNDGTSIPNITDRSTWANLTTPGYCFYNNDAVNKNIYGALYNWYTINSNKLAPAGWHVPTDAEWSTLTSYLINNGYGFVTTGILNLYGDDIAKSMASTTGWNSDTNTGAIGNDLSKNNSSGFAALPGGIRWGAWDFDYVGNRCYWWSTSDFNTSSAWTRFLLYNSTSVDRMWIVKSSGSYVRCVCNN